MKKDRPAKNRDSKNKRDKKNKKPVSTSIIDTGVPKKNQLIDKQAERYLRHPGNIEDLPTAGEQEDAETIIEKNKNTGK